MRWRRVLAAVVALVGGTSAILMSPVFSSRIIECLIGQRPEAEYVRLLGSLLAVYAVEPLFTFAYVRAMVGPARYCSPRRRIQLKTKNVGSECIGLLDIARARARAHHII